MAYPRASLPLLALLVAALLAACAPAADDERVEVAELTQPVTYYPHQTGLVWEYLPDGARLADPRVVRRIEGPTMLEGRVFTSSRLAGRGLDVRSFREYRADGVFLRREERPGTVITFDPPLQEFPAPGTLRVGATWAGEGSAEIVFPQARPENRRQALRFSYRYTVVDQREVTLVGGTYDVFVIDFVSRLEEESGELVEEISQQSWFTPFVGEVRTQGGYVLVETNAVDAQPTP